MKYVEIKPTAALANYVKCFWLLEKDYALPDQAIETIWPDGCLDLIFHFDNPLHLLSSGQAIQQSPAFLIGQLTQPIQLASSGYTRVFGIRFYPYGAYPFFQTSLKSTAGQTTSLEQIIGNLAHDLTGRIHERSLPDIASIAEAFLLTRLASHTVNISEVVSTTKMLYQEQGVVSIAALADYANMTKRNLERKFVEVVGYSPKTLARILRFNQIKNELILNPTLNLTSLAHHFHYFDQAHFIHDFQQFTNQTPSAFTEQVIKGDISFYK